MNPIGIMQGRLSSPAGGRIQSFPVSTWQDEFSRARDAGLDAIEWIYEAGADALNPLTTSSGVAEIHLLSATTGVAVRSACADYFMTDRLLDDDGGPRSRTVDRLHWLIDRAHAAALRYVVLPFVDASSAARLPSLNGLRATLRDVLAKSESSGIELHLETDLEPDSLASLLGDIGHPRLRATVDIGNSASLGHDADHEMLMIGPWLGSVHVKDRLRRGGSVPLGAGDADFETYFRHFAALGYEGMFLLQAARGSDGDEVDLARRNRAFVELAMRHASQHDFVPDRKDVDV